MTSFVFFFILSTMPFFTPPALISILIAITVHEAAHAFMARKLGDPTAEDAGRLTLNPIAHLDMLGSLMFLFVGFGWAKPVPVDPRYFSHPKRDNALVAVVGPLSNLVLAFCAFAGLVFMGYPMDATDPMLLLSVVKEGSVAEMFALEVLEKSLFINLALMAFNLLPVAPLDGSKVLQMFIPREYEDQYETIMQRGPIILLFLILAGIFLNFPFLLWWVMFIIEPVLRLMQMVAALLS